MKQGCVLAPTLFGAFFAEAFEDTAEGNYLRTKPDGMLFNISTLKQIPHEISAWSPLCQLTMQPSPPTQPKTLSSSWTISERPAKTWHWPPAWKIKTQVMAPNASTYLPALQSWSLNWRLSMTAYILARRSLTFFLWNPRRTAPTIPSLTKIVWSNKKLTENTKIQVYRASNLSTLL